MPSRTSMGQPTANASAESNSEMGDEDDLLALLKEILPGMLGMAGMFVFTILLGLWLLPFFDTAELYAFGEEGTTQVRYILLELIMIFIFTAAILFLAKYKKEWVIKYGLMFVIFLALMYTTVPAAHLILVDDHTEEFQFDENLSVNGTFFQSFEPELFMTEEFVDDGNNSSILVRQYDNTATLQWSDVQPFGPSGALESVEVVRNGNHLTFTNFAHIWTIDQTTGERVGNTFNCFVYDDDNVPQNTPYFDGGCDAAIQFEDTIYVVNQDSNFYKMNIFGTDSDSWGKQAYWTLPTDFSAKDSLTHMELLDQSHVFMASNNTAFVFKLGTNSPGIAGEPGVDISVDLLWSYNTTEGETITAVDIGLSPYDEVRNLSDWNDEGDHFISLGFNDGKVLAYNWDSENLTITPEERISLDEALAGPIHSVRILDLDSSNRSDLWIVDAYGVHGLFGDGMIEFVRIELSDEKPLELMVFEQDAGTQLALFSEDNQHQILFGEFRDTMYIQRGLNLDDTATLVGFLVALGLMIMLYVRPEWYVVNTVGVLVGAGVIVMLGVTFVPTLIMIFMVLAAGYDAWAVYRSKHMLDLADTMIGLKLPILLVAPQEKGYSMLEEQTPMRDKSSDVEKPKDTPSAQTAEVRKKSKGKDAMFMGLGDVIFPGMLVVSAVQWLPSDGLFVGLITMLGGLLGYLILMTYVAKGRPQAGLPLLNGGAILGYIIGGLIFVGTGILDFGITF